MGNKTSNVKQCGSALTFQHAGSISVSSTPCPKGENNYNTEIGGDTKYELDVVEEDIENNGIVGEYISSQIAEQVANFWRVNIMKMSKIDQLEVACTISFSLIAQNKEIKEIYFNSFRDVKLQVLSKKLFDLVCTWLCIAGLY